MKYYVGMIQGDSLYLEHHGIKGMRWGIRRFQNPDGTLTEAGKKRYGDNLHKANYDLINSRHYDDMRQHTKYKETLSKIQDISKDFSKDDPTETGEAWEYHVLKRKPKDVP